MAYLKKICRNLLLTWLLLAVPAQVLAAMTPCDVLHPSHTNHMLHQHDAADSKHHYSDHVPQLKCNGGCCCMGWISPASLSLSENISGSDKQLTPSVHFISFISETPQKPPNPYSV